MECGESGKDALVNADRILRPSVHIAPPISQNSVRIYRCTLARLTAFLHYYYLDLEVANCIAAGVVTENLVFSILTMQSYKTKMGLIFLRLQN